MDSTAKLLGRAEIDQANDTPRETVSVPEWGGDVLVRGLTSVEWDKWDAWLGQQADTPREIRHLNYTARLVAMGLIDETGKRLYQDHEINLLGARGAAPLHRLFEKIRELSGKDKKSAEGTEKNLETAPSASSG